MRIIKKAGKYSDLDLVAGCRKNDAKYQRLLFKKYAPKILTTCRRYEYAGFGADDILQETFILAFKNINQYKPELAQLSTWLNKIAVNTALKAIKKRSAKTVSIEDSYEQIENPSTETREIQFVSNEDILKCVASMPDGYKTVFNLYVIEGYDHAEISKILEISIQTSKSQLSRARKYIRNNFVYIKQELFYNKKI